MSGMPSRRPTRSPLFPFLFLLQNLLQVPLPSFLLFPQTAWATSTPSTNTTIDDTSPSFTWQSGWAASPCDYCSALLNTSLTYNGTWHDGGSRSGLTGVFEFNGTAVYLYGVTSQNDTGTIDFTLDGVNGTTYTPPIIPADDPSIGTPDADHTYNTLFFMATGLQDSSKVHKLEFTAVLGYNTSQTVLIDYAIVTTNDGGMTSSSSSGEGEGSSDGSGQSSSGGGSENKGSGGSGSNKGALIGGIVGGVVGAFLLLSLALFLYIRRRRKSQPRSSQIKPENRIEPLRIAPVVSFTGDSNSPITASTLSASSTNLKTRHFQSLPTIEAAVTSAVTETSQAGSSPTQTQNNVRHEDDLVSTSSPRPRTHSSTAADPSILSSSIGTTTRSRQEIQQMEQRIRSLESMILLQGRNNPTIGVPQGAHAHASTVLMSPFSEHGAVPYDPAALATSMEDLTNPPPPY
ncbi:hypothetical protein F5880DRAFT_1615795 [Lentinula raphanica]|nr:hypothetical protein F5880DRAFT_1615795 [Lentinula raphanica]